MSKENTAVFIGHNECYGVTSEQIKEAIVSLIDKGVTEFLSADLTDYAVAAFTN